MKRRFEDDGADGGLVAYSKRPKTQEHNDTSGDEPLDIKTSADLEALLAFKQGNIDGARRRLQSFRKFLEELSQHGNDEVVHSTRSSVLLEYWKSSIQDSAEESARCLLDLIQTWSFAAQTNNDSLLTTVPSVLALLLRTVSGDLSFRECGLILCKTLLRKEQIQLLKRGLSGAKPKEYHVLPCIRLLTEILTFDGGSCARTIYAQRDVTLARLDVFLGMRVYAPPDGKRTSRKPSVREAAIQYLLANFRLQDKHAKEEMLSSTRIGRALFQDIMEDPPATIRTILDIIKRSIAQDTYLHRSAKSRLLTDSTLSRIVGLYSYNDTDDEDNTKSIPSLAHRYLLHVCTSLDQGVLVAQRDWYLPGSEQKRGTHDATTIFNRLSADPRYVDRLPVRNTTLAAFSQTLRPFASTLQKELLCAIFHSAPELVADYFLRKRNFSFDPKLTATWIGYYAFLLSVIRLPIPTGLASGEVKEMPPAEIILENILPRPLDRKVLTRCFTQSSELITSFGTNILLAAFEKMKQLLVLLGSPGDHANGSCTQLLELFQSRCPELKHIVTAYKTCPSQQSILRLNLARLLSLYYKVVPEMALEDKLDMSQAFLQSLDTTDTGKSPGIRSLLLAYLLEVASKSTDMRWWHKPGDANLAPGTAILKMYTASPQHDVNLKVLIQSIMEDHGILRRGGKVSSFDALSYSLRPESGGVASDAVYSFIDECMARLTRKPILYLGEVVEQEEAILVSGQDSGGEEISLLAIVAEKQWAFVPEGQGKPDIAHWLARFLAALTIIGESRSKIQRTVNNLARDSKSNGTREVWDAELDPLALQSMDSATTGPSDIDAIISNQVRVPEHESDTNDEWMRPRAIEYEDYPALTRWAKYDVVDAVENGSVADLLSCFFSELQEIRLSAQSQLRQLISKVQNSDYMESAQLYLLLGELLETLKSTNPTTAYPAFPIAIARSCLIVLAQPLHSMYTKVNKFLNRGPVWRTSSLPRYWIDKVILQPPTEDDAYHKEVNWLLDNLKDGLRASGDVELYRKNDVFEAFLTLSNSMALSQSSYSKIAELIYHASEVGGSTTLATRVGVMPWIEAFTARQMVDAEHLAQLRATQDAVDADRVTEWSNGRLPLVK